jgi:predicted DsbA family dithiol-disulfide isomerase
VTEAPGSRVEIWSDVVCPFCYIGKRQLEVALAEWPERDRVEVVWRSFQLAPDTRTDPTLNSLQHLARKKGWTLEFTREAMAAVTNRAKAVGLNLDFDRATVVNTFDAHRLGHYAALHGKGDEITERLFKAYFVDGRNVGDHATLAVLGAEVGLSEAGVRAMLGSDQFAVEVRRDIEEATGFGIDAVPCFVFDRKFAVSGAQESTVLLQALRQSLAE